MRELKEVFIRSELKGVFRRWVWWLIRELKKSEQKGVFRRWVLWLIRELKEKCSEDGCCG
jgi:hypothetical protein